MHEQRLTQMQSELVQAQASESVLRERLQNVHAERAQVESERDKEVALLKHGHAREIQGVHAKISEQERLIGEMHTKIVTVESEQDRDKALLRQKVEFLEDKIKEMATKDRERDNEIKHLKT